MTKYNDLPETPMTAIVLSHMAGHSGSTLDECRDNLQKVYPRPGNPYEFPVTEVINALIYACQQEWLTPVKSHPHRPLRFIPGPRGKGECLIDPDRVKPPDPTTWWDMRFDDLF